MSHSPYLVFKVDMMGFFFAQILELNSVIKWSDKLAQIYILTLSHQIKHFVTLSRSWLLKKKPWIVFKATILQWKVTLGWGHQGLIIPQMQDRSRATTVSRLLFDCVSYNIYFYYIPAAAMTSWTIGGMTFKLRIMQSKRAVRTLKTGKSECTRKLNTSSWRI